MLKFAICNEIFEGWPLKEAFRFIAETGYDGVEIAPFTLASNVFDLSDDCRREIRQAAEAYDLAIAGLHWLLVGPPGVHINHPDPCIRRNTLAYLVELVRFCSQLGGRVLVLGSPKQRQVLPDITPSDAKAMAMETFAACAEVAQSEGVVLCLEALPAENTNFLNTTAEVVEIVREIDSPGLRVIVDVKSMLTEPIPVVDQIAMAAPYLAHFHANDINRQAPGFGPTDFVPILQTLESIGYIGYVSVEVFDFRPDARTVAIEGLAYLRRCQQASR